MISPIPDEVPSRLSMATLKYLEKSPLSLDIAWSLQVVDIGVMILDRMMNIHSKML